MPQLLLDEPPLIILPTLAKLIGLNESILVQQLNYLLNQKHSGREHGGHKWIFNTYEQWQEYFPFWSLRTIERVFESCHEKHIVEWCQPEGRSSRRKWYRLNFGMLSLLCNGRVPDDANLAGSEDAKLAGSESAIMAGSLVPKTSSKTSSKNTGNPASSMPQDLRLAVPPHSRRSPNQPPSESALSDAQSFRDKLLAPDFSPGAGWKTAWARAFDKLVADGRDLDDVWEVCKWARKDSFWSAHFHVPTQLVKRKAGVMRYDQLLSAMHAGKKKSAEPCLSC